MDDEHYEVGYRKPPKHTRFQKGKSGNPSGRSKKPEKALRDVLGKVLNEKITVGINGRRQKVQKIDVLVRKILNKALEGDFKSAKLLLDMSKHLGLNEERQETHEEWVRRFNAKKADEGDS